ncbi:MAG: hypothetical protein Q4P11_00370 [Methanobrevibacter sp.]|nr:hypothetical protein [Methanobrevibacter sp.]
MRVLVVLRHVPLDCKEHHLYKIPYAITFHDLIRIIYRMAVL